MNVTRFLVALQRGCFDGVVSFQLMVQLVLGRGVPPRIILPVSLSHQVLFLSLVCTSAWLCNQAGYRKPCFLLTLRCAEAAAAP